jgi:hypothetical protein
MYELRCDMQVIGCVARGVTQAQQRREFIAVHSQADPDLPHFVHMWTTWLDARS